MIYVSQGHEKGIGLEIFLKSILLFSKEVQQKFFLAVDEDCFNENLKNINCHKDLYKNLNIHFLKKNDFPISTKSLSVCLTHLKEKDILITLPTSKDQLIFSNKNQAGYTEFFRSYFQNNEISMLFHANSDNVLLITDHKPIAELSHIITPELVYNKIALSLKNFKKYFYEIDEVIISGLNPHAGENGILGTEEIKLANALDRLKTDFPTISFKGFISGDTLHFHKNINKRQLFVYMFHDQGLAKFKSDNGVIGLNVSLGLPFLRLSVDHGTAFDLYGKNQANINGMIYLINKALEVHSHVNQ